jgi:hypothetical protein
MSARRPYRGPAGAIDPTDPAPFDPACIRPDAYYEALARVDDHLTECVGELDMLTPPEPDLRHLGEILARARDHYIRRRTHAVQLTFPFHTQTTPDV